MLGFGASKTTVDAVDTELPADSVEFCPRAESCHILVCGTYNLVQNEDGTKIDSCGDKQPQTRNGRCLVYGIEKKSQKLKELQRIETAAILDLKWSYDRSSPKPLLAIAESVGRLQIHEWDQEKNELSVVQVIQAAESNVLCLSIDWNDRILSQGTRSLATSKSDGTLSILTFTESHLEVTSTWQAHDFEPWVAAWNYWNPYVLYSGGDDCKLKGWDTRASYEAAIFTNKRFEAGVTCIQTHPFVENIVAVGSYDSTVRIFDTRKMTAPMTDVGVGGGAWRVKWHPSITRKEDLLVACMHDGFKTVRVPIFDGSSDGITVPPAITSVYNAHTSLAYGVDWQPSPLQGNISETTIASCSFYDHALHLWSS